MTDQTPCPGFGEVGAALRQMRSPSDPAEVHGMLCGMLLAVRDSDAWLSRISAESPGDGSFSQESREVLLALFRATVEQLDDEGLGFCLLLPDDDEPVTLRTTALAHWIQGFLFGLGQSRLEGYGNLSAEAKEFLRDLGDLAQVEVGAEDKDEENEAAYAEIVEYLRVGVLLLDQELHAPAGPVPQSRLQ